MKIERGKNRKNRKNRRGRSLELNHSLQPNNTKFGDKNKSTTKEGAKKKKKKKKKKKDGVPQNRTL